MEVNVADLSLGLCRHFTREKKPKKSLRKGLVTALSQGKEGIEIQASDWGSNKNGGFGRNGKRTIKMTCFLVVSRERQVNQEMGKHAWYVLVLDVETHGGLRKSLLALGNGQAAEPDALQTIGKISNMQMTLREGLQRDAYLDRIQERGLINHALDAAHAAERLFHSAGTQNFVAIRGLDLLQKGCQHMPHQRRTFEEQAGGSDLDLLLPLGDLVCERVLQRLQIARDVSKSSTLANIRCLQPHT